MAAEVPSNSSTESATASTAESGRVLEGLFAVAKPEGITSADVIRDLQRVFKPSRVFKPWLEHEKAKRSQEPMTEKLKRKIKKIEVKMGHGGTLDPMATGVLIIGCGQGTRSLQQFLECSKEYVVEAIFGCSTDTYDRTGKVMHKAPYEHVTREMVEEALANFRGNITQKPPIFSALRINGKRYYEYAREGKPLPIEIKGRPVTVHELELLDFTTDHKWEWPKEQADKEELELEKYIKTVEEKGEEAAVQEAAASLKREREDDASPEDSSKRIKTKEGSEEASETTNEPKATVSESIPRPPVVKLRMSVSSGFYVRSLVHDLGEALNSAANMVSLARTRQGEYALGKNVFEWEIFDEKAPEKWESKIEHELSTWLDNYDPAGKGPAKKRNRPGPKERARSRSRSRSPA